MHHRACTRTCTIWPPVVQQVALKDQCWCGTVEGGNTESYPAAYMHNAARTRSAAIRGNLLLCSTTGLTKMARHMGCCKVIIKWTGWPQHAYHFNNYPTAVIRYSHIVDSLVCVQLFDGLGLAAPVLHPYDVYACRKCCGDLATLAALCAWFRLAAQVDLWCCKLTISSTQCCTHTVAAL